MRGIVEAIAGDVQNLTWPDTLAFGIEDCIAQRMARDRGWRLFSSHHRIDCGEENLQAWAL